MTIDNRYGVPLTAATIGIVLKELVRRAMHEIRKQRLTFEATPKESWSGKPDLVTSADLAAQAIYVRQLRECLPGYGLVGEENGLREPCTLSDIDAWVAVDPLDGTRAYGRGQAFGVATQIAMAINGEIATTYVGDVITGDIFGYRPESGKVHHITNLDSSVNLREVDRDRPLTEQVALLRDMPETLHPLVAALVRPTTHGGAVRQYEIASGSLTLSLSRLWKGEVGMCVLPSHLETPWDSWPMIGMAQRLDLAFLRPTADGQRLERYQPTISIEPYERDHDTIILPAEQTRLLEQMIN